MSHESSLSAAPVAYVRVATCAQFQTATQQIRRIQEFAKGSGYKVIRSFDHAAGRAVFKRECPRSR